MLTELRIQNYALIREMEVKLSPGLSIITGETGAGKSILLGALSLILGQRADASVLKDQSVKCVVEAIFRIDSYGLEELFDQYDIDYEQNSIFRREINPGGKSRAFINDTPVNLKALEEIGYRLIDIHSQNRNLELNSQNFQMMVLDIVAGNRPDLEDYRKNFKEYNKTKAQLKEAEAKSDKIKEELDYFEFQFNQLQNASLVENEQENLEQELEILNHAEEIKTNLSNCTEILNGDHDSTLVQVKNALNHIARIRSFMPESESLHNRLESIFIELKDIAAEVESLSGEIEHDPDRTGFINERLNLIYSLEQKHHVKNTGELISLREYFRNKILEVATNEEEIISLKALLEKNYEAVMTMARRLSRSRNDIIAQMETAVAGQLQQLGLPNSKFKVQITSDEPPGINGTDNVSFLFSANKNSPLYDLSKVASGGELSRVMLTIKALISKSKALPTILFDEIDSGISGEIADKMGNILKDMSRDMQVINITHLPQIAAKGSQHFLVYKQDNNHETLTGIKLLSAKERVEEIAKMLSGENISNAAILNAEELLSGN